MSSLPLAALSVRRGFVADPRLSRWTGGGDSSPSHAEAAPSVWQSGFDAGYAAAREAADAERHAEREAMRQLDLALGRIDHDAEAALGEKLRLTVLALCEEAVLPLAIDEHGLLRRIELAISMLRRASDECVLVLHPDDLALLRLRLPENLRTAAEPSLERGAMRLETDTGGIEDGPEQWRRLLAEAFGRC